MGATMKTIPFLLALMAAVGMQSGTITHVDEKKLDGRAWWSTQDFGPAPFDVPPKVIHKWTPPLPENWDGYETYENLSCKLQGAYDTTDKMCIDGKVYKSTISRTCEDKSRFLLMSEDNKWHRLNLGAKP